jgi:hypothetical protein
MSRLVSLGSVPVTAIATQICTEALLEAKGLMFPEISPKATGLKIQVEQAGNAAEVCVGFFDAAGAPNPATGQNVIMRIRDDKLHEPFRGESFNPTTIALVLTDAQTPASCLVTLEFR